MRRRLVWVQYRKLLQTKLIGAAETVFIGIADTVLAGRLFGDDALAGVSLAAPAASLVLFISALVTSGAMISRSIAVGKGDRKEMDLCCSTGLWASLAVAVGLGLMFLGTDAYLAAMGVTGAARTTAADYCRGYWLVAAVTPINFLVYDLCSTDGGHRCCRIASVSNMALKLAAAIPLARTFGISGLAFSTAFGLAASTVIMAFHLRSDANTLRFVGGFSLRTFLAGIRFSVLDQLFLLGDALKMLAVNAFVVSCLGERFLPVVSVFTAISTLRIIQCATAVSAQPLVDVYFGEGNNRRVKTVARMGVAVTFACGLLPAAALLAFPDLVSSFIGLTDPDLQPYARAAVRIAAAFLPLSHVCGFMDSFYIYTERLVLSFVLILMDSCVAPILLGLGLGWLFAANGLWLGLASAPVLALAGVVAFAYARYGNPYCQPSDRDALTFVFDLELGEREIAALSGRVKDILKQHGRYSGDAVKAPLVVEEALTLVRERNAGRRVLAEATLDLNDEVALALRDDGEIFDLTGADAGATPLRACLVSNAMSGLRAKFNLVTMGVNRSWFRLAEGSAGAECADTVVYGAIRTAETEMPVAEALAVKDGKFVYVGDEAGAAAFVKDGVTKVIDHRGKGMVMPGCTDGHAHYILPFTLANMKGGVLFGHEDGKADVLRKLEAAARAAKEAGKRCLFGFGWNYYIIMPDKPSLRELDAVTHGVSAVIFDSSGHNALCNSECLRRCGIIDGKGKVLVGKIDGGVLELDGRGYPTGFVDERVTGYLTRMGGIDADEIVDDKLAETAILKSQELLLSTGYVTYMEGWSNMLHPTKYYEAASRLDREGRLKILLPMTYEVEHWQKDIGRQIDRFVSLKEKYETRHVRPEYLKVFMDGCLETKTGATSKPYKDGVVYKPFWSVDRLADITRECNAKGIVVHTHTMGDVAISDVTDAYVKGGDGKHRNCLVHIRHPRKEDFKRFAKNNIACVAGMTWHIGTEEAMKAFSTFFDEEYVMHSYPIKSFFDAGVKVTSHSDFPANEICPQDPFGIMEIAVSGRMPHPVTGELTKPFYTEELVTREQVFQALTLNGAWQVGLENERGSIKVGKWADFVLADRDVFACPVTDIRKTKVVSTWFEGSEVCPKTSQAGWFYGLSGGLGKARLGRFGGIISGKATHEKDKGKDKS